MEILRYCDTCYDRLLGGAWRRLGDMLVCDSCHCEIRKDWNFLNRANDWANAMNHPSAFCSYPEIWWSIPFPERLNEMAIGCSD